MSIFNGYIEAADLEDFSEGSANDFRRKHGDAVEDAHNMLGDTTFNVRGLADKLKQKYVAVFMESSNIDILLLQETGHFYKLPLIG